MSNPAKSTGDLNAKGNRRGMPKASRKGLARGRKVAQKRRGQKPRGSNGAFTPSTRGGLGGNAARLIPDRLRVHIEALKESPGLLDALLSGTISADMIDANRCLEIAWSVAYDYFTRARDGNDEALERATALLAELRKWTKLPQDLAVRIEALNRTPSGGDYLEDRYGDDTPEGHEDAQVPPDAAEAEVVEEDVATPGEGAHGATSADGPGAPLEGDGP